MRGSQRWLGMAQALSRRSTGVAAASVGAVTASVGLFVLEKSNQFKVGNRDVANAWTILCHADDGGRGAPIPVPKGGGAANEGARVSGCAGDKNNPFVYDELTEGLARRQQAELTLRRYIAAKQPEVQARMQQAKAKGGPAELRKVMAEIEKEVSLQSQIITYGVCIPNDRQRYMEAYGCVRWSEQAIHVIKSYGPIVEIGAGLGHWQRKLESSGVDIIAFDNGSSIPNSDKQKFVGKVFRGDEREASKYPKRSLLLCYPGPDDTALKALNHYSGDILLYVGEGKGGANATNAFFQSVEKNWECIDIVRVEPYAECFEKLFVFNRKKAKK